MNYSEVYRAMGIDGELRERILDVYRSRGGSFHVWMIADIEKMAYSITKVEDEIELEGRNHAHQACREPLKIVRRTLENDLL